MPWGEIAAARKSGHGLNAKWMPTIEACHKGPIPLSACSHVVVVCAVKPSEFQRMALHPFNLAELERLEAECRERYAEDYEIRAIPVPERMNRRMPRNT